MNEQTPEGRPRETDGQTLDVHSVFHTIQGEGPFSGRPAVFVRLAGCNLQCPGCDTSYTEGRQRQSLLSLLDDIEAARLPNTKLVVITGGEPLRQNIVPLACQLRIYKLDVQIETNGSYEVGKGFPHDATIVCSPKTSKVAAGMEFRIDAYKYVIEHDKIDVTDGLPTGVLGRAYPRPARPPKGFTGPVFVTPFDSLSLAHNHNNRLAAAAVAEKYGYTLQLQIHKQVGLP